jgi:hypothetical protein
MSIPGIREKTTASRPGAADTPGESQRPGIVITGSCADSTFVAAKVLICADTLSAELAIQTWLEAHGIQVAGYLRLPGRDEHTRE